MKKGMLPEEITCDAAAYNAACDRLQVEDLEAHVEAMAFEIAAGIEMSELAELLLQQLHVSDPFEDHEGDNDDYEVQVFQDPLVAFQV